LDGAAVVADGGDCAHAKSRIFPKMDIRSASPISLQRSLPIVFYSNHVVFSKFERLKL
jgi:hypothetical protein